MTDSIYTETLDFLRQKRADAAEQIASLEPKLAATALAVKLAAAREELTACDRMLAKLEDPKSAADDAAAKAPADV